MDEDELIATLRADLSPAPALGSVRGIGLLWLLVSVIYVFVLSAVLGPFRPGFVAELFSVSRFSLEMVLGLAALCCFIGVALLESVPGRQVARLRKFGWLLFGIWLVQFVVGFVAPALEPSMLGKRDHCALEAYLYSVPPLVWLIYLQRRRYVLNPTRAVLHSALAAGLVPALMMQIACMYEPGHILVYHVLPIGILATFAVGLTWILSRRGGS